MHLHELLTPSRVAIPLVARTKDDVLAELVALATPGSMQQSELLVAVRAREAVFPTALDDGVALPHVRTTLVSTVQLAAGRLREPIPYGAANGNAVDLFFLVLSPSHAPSEHLQVLRSLSDLLADPSTVAALRAASSPSEFLATISACTASR